jgi:hypothetical protein
MKKYALSLVVVALGVGVAMPAQAFLCPQLVKDCTALIAKVESRGGDAGKLAHAREHCQRAQALHEQGKHADSVITAGDAIQEAGKAAK